MLRLSETTLTREIEQWEEKANAEQTKQNVILQNSKTGGGGGNILFNVVWPHQKEGLVCLLLKERAEKAKDVFSKAQDILDVRIEFLTDMINILQSAKIMVPSPCLDVKTMQAMVIIMILKNSNKTEFQMLSH